MNEVVKYNNYMNSLKFTNFTTTDFNFLMLLCNKMRDKDTIKFIVSFEELRQKSNYTRTSIQQFVSDLERMNEKLMKITCKLKTETKIMMFVLFPIFEIDLENQTLTVCVNENFKFILNDLIKNFTRFDLSEFINLDSRYSKSLYRLLKQYRTTGRYEVKLDEFRNKMDCPKAYNNKQFMQNVINPALKELQNYFNDLQCMTRYAHKRGKPVEGYIFTFEPEQPLKATPTTAESPANQQQQSGSQKHYISNNYNSKNKFYQCHQREVTQEELDALEKKLLADYL